MYACMTPVGFDTSDKFENHCARGTRKQLLKFENQSKGIEITVAIV